MLGCPSWEPEGRGRDGAGPGGRGRGPCEGRGGARVRARRGGSHFGVRGPPVSAGSVGEGFYPVRELPPIAEGWRHLWAGGPAQHRSPGARRGEHPAAARSPRPSPPASPSGCSLPRSALPPHLPAKHQLKRLFWQKHALTVTQLFKENISPFFSWHGSGQFPERSSGHSQRPRGPSSSDAGARKDLSFGPCGLLHLADSGVAVTHPGSAVPAAGAGSRSHSGAHGCACCPGGPLPVTPNNLGTPVSHHWPHTFGCGWTNPGRETADSLLPSVMCRQGALLVTHFSLSGLCSSRQVCPTSSLEECLSS